MADPKQLASLLSEEEELRRFNAAQGDQPWYSKALPMEGRATLLPFRDTMEGSVFNKRELALPGILAGALNAFTSPARALTGSDPTFKPGEEAANMALNTFGGGIATGKALANPTGLGGKDLALNVWHGTPHEIKGGFDISKVGTGEGAQAYGHGMYFAEAKDLGTTYRRKLTDEAGNPVTDPNKSIQLQIGRLEDQIKQLKQSNDPNAASMIKAYQSRINEIDKAGNLYKADIPDAAIPMMLDWDKPFNQQPKVIQDAFTKLYTNKNIADQDLIKWFSGIDKEKGHMAAFYNNLATSDNLKGAKDVSRLLLQEGIPGIKYLDEGSRAAGKGTSNYVVFDPSKVKILEKNDVPVTRKELLQQEFDKLEK
jgi:hypothetical protein